MFITKYTATSRIKVLISRVDLLERIWICRLDAVEHWYATYMGTRGAVNF